MILKNKNMKMVNDHQQIYIQTLIFIKHNDVIGLFNQPLKQKWKIKHHRLFYNSSVIFKKKIFYSGIFFVSCSIDYVFWNKKYECVFWCFFFFCSFLFFYF